MNKNFIGATLFITSLILNPVIVSPLSANIQVKINSVSASISSILHKRGLDEDAAQSITNTMIGDNEELFNAMLRNIENGCEVLTQNEILEFLSTSALFKKEVKLDSYAFLVNMVHKIKNTSLNEKTLKELQNIANKNSLYIDELTT